MGIISHFFGKASRQSPLRVLLGALSFEQSATTHRTVTDPSLRLPAALSIWALHLAHRYAEGLEKMVGNQDGGIGAVNAAYDRIASEAAALAHFWLLRDFLREDELDDEDETYIEVLKVAAQLSNTILMKEAPLVARKEWILNRALGCSHAEKFKSKTLGEQFDAHILEAIGPNASLRTQLAVATYYPIFESAHYKPFNKSARVMYIAHQSDAL